MHVLAPRVRRGHPFRCSVSCRTRSGRPVARAFGVRWKLAARCTHHHAATGFARVAFSSVERQGTAGCDVGAAMGGSGGDAAAGRGRRHPLPVWRDTPNGGLRTTSGLRPGAAARRKIEWLVPRSRKALSVCKSPTNLVRSTPTTSSRPCSPAVANTPKRRGGSLWRRLPRHRLLSRAQSKRHYRYGRRVPNSTSSVMETRQARTRRLNQSTTAAR